MNKEEVKEVLEYCVNSDSGSSCMECKFFDFADCRYELIKCAIKLIDKQEAEIERLKADNKALEMWNECYTEQFKTNKQSVKEFTEKLKERCHNYYPSIDYYCCSQKAVNVKDIDELLKEYEVEE